MATRDTDGGWPDVVTSDVARMNPYESPISAELVLPSAFDPHAGLVREGETWILHYQLERDDFVALGLLHWEKSRAQRSAQYKWALYWMALVALVALVPLAISGVDIRRYWLPMLASAAFVLAIILLSLQPSRLRRAIRKQYERLYAEGSNQALFGAYRAIITPARLIVSGPLMETHYRWEAIERIERAPQYIVLYVSALNGIILPVRAFRDAAQCDEFVAEIAMRTGRGLPVS